MRESVKLLILSVLDFVIYLILALTKILPLHIFYIFMLIILPLLTWLVISQALKNRQDSTFILRFVNFTVLKLFVVAALVFIFSLLLPKEQRAAFLIFNAVLYLEFLGWEVYELQR